MIHAVGLVACQEIKRDMAAERSKELEAKLEAVTKNANHAVLLLLKTGLVLTKFHNSRRGCKQVCFFFKRVTF